MLRERRGGELRGDALEQSVTQFYEITESGIRRAFTVDTPGAVSLTIVRVR